MASTVLPNGIIIPEKYSRDWYNDLYHNWQELDNLLGGGTPKDGTLTIQKNGATVGTFSANQSTNETVNITVPNVNDGTLTIQKNGTTVDTFTANSSTDKTVNITVPTATSELANDSGFITEDTTKIPLAGSNAISGSLIPSTDGTVNLGSPSYQWNNAYIKSLTINGVACGDILTHNASEFVNVTSAQTIGGVKTFTSSIGIVKDSGDVELSIKNTSLSLKANTNSGMDDIRFTDKDNLIVGGLRQSFTNSKVIGMAYSRSYSSDGNSYTQAEFTLVTDNQNGINDAYVKCDNFYPNTNATINLGTSTNKWKSFNGINPGALSLPSISSTGANAWIAIDTTNWVKNTAVSLAQKYTPLADGWLNVRVDNATMLAIAVGGNYMHQVIRSETANSLALLMPVFKNTEVAIMTGGNENLAYNRVTFYYCQGNV